MERSYSRGIADRCGSACWTRDSCWDVGFMTEDGMAGSLGNVSEGRVENLIGQLGKVLIRYLG